MPKTFNISLPFFEGFYESVYENSDTEYYAINNEIEWYEEYKDEKHECGEFEFDYKRRRQDIVEAFCDAFHEMCPEWVTGVKFEALDSPKYYNYATDRVFADVTFDDCWRDKLLDFIKDNYIELKKQIYEDWSCCEGFISFMENGIEDWVIELKKEEPDKRYISYLIGYWLMNGFDWDDSRVMENLRYLTMDNIYDHEYVSLKTED